MINSFNDEPHFQTIHIQVLGLDRDPAQENLKQQHKTHIMQIRINEQNLQNQRGQGHTHTFFFQIKSKWKEKHILSHGKIMPILHTVTQYVHQYGAGEYKAASSVV